MSDRGRRPDKRNPHSHHPSSHGHYHNNTPNHYYNNNGNGGGPSNFPPKSYPGPPRGITKKEETCPLCGRMLDPSRIRKAEHLKQCAEVVMKQERNEPDNRTVEDPDYEAFFENLRKECEKLETEKKELESVQQLAEQCINKERLEQIQSFLRGLVEEKMKRNDSLCTTNIVATASSPKGTTEEVADITYVEPVRQTDPQIKEEEEKSNENIQVTTNNAENQEPKKELAIQSSKKIVLDKQRLKKSK